MQVPPLLRREVLCCEAASGEYVHGYMVNAGFGESISQWHEQHPEVPLHFFWDKPDEPEVCRMDETLSFHQLDDEKFLRYMSGCRAYATTAGFESVCEAMYLGIDGKVYTAATVGTVLPGVTRRSCIELLKDWGYDVIEGKLAIADIMQAAREGKLEEVFGTGTAAVVSPVKELVWKGEHAYISNT